MADLYNFSKITKEQTKEGQRAFIIGIVSIVMLVILILVSAIFRGQIPENISLVMYISLLLSLLGLTMAIKAKRNSDLYGKMIDQAIKLNAIVAGIHVIIIFIGLVKG